MRNIKLTIEYDGTNYQGWQRQKNTSQTLQEIIEKTLTQILQEKVRLIASGRTDAGVHAHGQVANFKAATKIPSNKLKYALNRLLPNDIVITNVEDVGLEFHARFDVKSKTYRYTILNRNHPSALQSKFTYFIPYKLDFKSMQKGARLLIGRHDFRSFQAGPVKNSDSSVRKNISKNRPNRKPSGSIRVIKGIKVSKDKDFIFIDIQANGFLYKMARSIVGTLIEIGKERHSPTEIRKIIALKNRKFAGPTVPAHGLCLLRVQY